MDVTRPYARWTLGASAVRLSLRYSSSHRADSAGISASVGTSKKAIGDTSCPDSGGRLRVPPMIARRDQT